MSTAQTKIRINSEVKKQSHEPELDVEEQYSDKLVDAAIEARHISHDPDVMGYTSMKELNNALEN